MKKQTFKISIFVAILSSLIIPISALAYSVYNYDATNITQTSATIRGGFDVDGDRAFDTWFIIYDGTAGTFQSTPKEKHSKGQISRSISGLSANRQYGTKFCFERDGTTHCASYINFTTLPTLPIPTTGIASSISGITAKLKGTWTTVSGSSTSVWFQYSKDSSLTTNIISTMPQNLGGFGSISQNIGNLELSTTYYFRLVTKNRASATPIYGETKNFKTLDTLLSSDITFNEETPSVATVSTGNANNISYAEATLNGSATPDTEPTTVYFRYSNEVVPPIFCKDIYGSNMVSTKDIKLDSSKSFYQPISGLQDSTEYFYCAIVSSKNGIKYGEVKNFTTLPCPTCEQTTVITNNAMGIDQTSAYLKGSYSSTKTITTYFEYKTDTGTNEISIVGGPISKIWTKINSSVQNHNANSYGNASFLLSGLKAGTKYNFKFVAEQTEEPNEIKYGDTLSFTTKSSNGGDGLMFVPDNLLTPTMNEPFVNQGGVYNNTTNNGNSGTIIGPNGPITNPTVGQAATAPSDAIVHYHEGIETVFARQIIANPSLAKRYGYAEGANLETFAWYLADLLARSFGYVAGNGEEIRVTTPDVAAYQLILSGNKLTVYEYFYGKIINIQSMTGNLRNIYGYEYYFKK